MPTKKLRTKPLWDIDQGVTFSGLSKWTECREQFSLQYIDGITPKKLSIPLEFGSIMHYALEHQFKDTPTEVVHRVTDQYTKYRSRSLINTEEKETLSYITGLAKITFPAYCKYWEEDDAKLNWVSREDKFDVIYKLPYGGSTRDIRLRGMRDGIYRAKNVLGLFETKTKGRISDNEILTTLHSDMQTMFYIVATYLDTNEFCNEVKYNVIRRADLYRRKKEDLVTYLRRVAGDIESRPEHYFKRYKVTVLRKDIINFIERTLNPLLFLFVQWWDSVKKNPLREARFQSPYHLLNCSALVGKYGKSHMWDAMFGNMKSYTVRSDTFPELVDAFQVTFKV